MLAKVVVEVRAVVEGSVVVREAVIVYQQLRGIRGRNRLTRLSIQAESGNVLVISNRVRLENLSYGVVDLGFDVEWGSEWVYSLQKKMGHKS